MQSFENITTFIRELYNKPEGFIPLHAPVFRGAEKEYLNECIDSTYVSSVGKFVDLFEERVAEYTGSKKAVACVNGTSALFLALKMAGVQENTEVITQPLTFIATANAITYCGAEPVFIDVDFDTMGLSPKALTNWIEKNVEIREINESPNQEASKTIKQAYNKQTKRKITACVPMHTFGHPCRIDEIVNICKSYGIPVVEDAAESLGSFYKNKHTGTFGETGVLSFNGNKVLTTGGGGMLLFNDEKMAARAKHLTTQARVPHAWEFIHDETGYNYRMPNINAALGLAQMEQLKEFLKSKRMIAEKYKVFFKEQGEAISFVSEPSDSLSNYWLNAVLLNDKNERERFLKHSNEKGIMTRPSWTLMNDLKMFKHCQTDELKTAKEIYNRLVNIPSSVL